MSFRIQPTAPARPNRCQLFGPGSRPAIFEKMAKSDADVINIDLEDSVAPSDKDSARENIIQAIGDIDWGAKTLSVRINGLDTPFWYRDVVDLLERAPDRLDQIMIPKVGCAADLYAVDALVSAVEVAKGRSKRIAFEVIIESAAGIAHVEEIAAASPRLEAMSLGAADFAASMGMQTTGIGGTQENYYMLHEGQKHWSDPWHWAQTAIVAACRTHGVLPVDGPFGDFSDDEGFRAQALRSATLGIVGKWAIHPKQVALANEIFTLSDAAVTEAREILAAMEEAKAKGEGATVYKGRLVDIASIKQAEVIVRQFEKCVDAQRIFVRKFSRSVSSYEAWSRRSGQNLAPVHAGLFNQPTALGLSNTPVRTTSPLRLRRRPTPSMRPCEIAHGVFQVVCTKFRAHTEFQAPQYIADQVQTWHRETSFQEKALGFRVEGRRRIVLALASNDQRPQMGRFRWGKASSSKLSVRAAWQRIRQEQPKGTPPDSKGANVSCASHAMNATARQSCDLWIGDAPPKTCRPPPAPCQAA